MHRLDRLCRESIRGWLITIRSVTPSIEHGMSKIRLWRGTEDFLVRLRGNTANRKKEIFFYRRGVFSLCLPAVIVEGLALKWVTLLFFYY